MTALTVERVHGHRGSQTIPNLHRYPMAATKILAGAIVALTASGYLTHAVGTDPTLRVVGVARETVDNSAGNAGDKRCLVEKGVFKFVNSAGADALTIADVGNACYALDNQTLARTIGDGRRCIAGQVWNILNDGGVELLVGVDPTNDDAEDLLLPAASDLSSKQNTFVKLNTSLKVAAASAAGEDCIGVLLNAPVQDAIAIVRTRGRARVYASAAINPGTLLATTNAGQSKAAVASTTNTSDAGVAADPLVGSFALGRALETGANGALHTVIVERLGAIPSTAA